MVKHLTLLKIWNDGYQRGLASLVYKFFDKKTSGGAATLVQLESLWPETFATRATQNKSAIKNKNTSNKELAVELHKPVITNSRKEKYTHLL